MSDKCQLYEITPLAYRPLLSALHIRDPLSFPFPFGPTYVLTAYFMGLKDIWNNPDVFDKTGSLETDAMKWLGGPSSPALPMGPDFQKRRQGALMLYSSKSVTDDDIEIAAHQTASNIVACFGDGILKDPFNNLKTFILEESLRLFYGYEMCPANLIATQNAYKALATALVTNTLTGGHFNTCKETYQTNTINGYMYTDFLCQFDFNLNDALFYLTHLCYDILAKCESSGQNNPMISHLRAKGYTDEAIVHELIFQIGASFGTTTASITNALTILGMPNYHYLQNILINSGEAGSGELASCVVEETNRLLPGAAFTSRTAVVDVLINGKLIRKGTEVMFLPSVSNRNPDLVGDHPNHFDIYRYDRYPDILSNLTTFGFKGRFCHGMRPAKMISKAMVLSLLNRYDIKTLDMNFTLGHTVTPSKNTVWEMSYRNN